jgi:hypothetical protein
MSTLEIGSELQERLDLYQSSTHVVHKSFALCSRSDGTKLKPEQKLTKTLRHFTSFPLATLLE